MPVVRTLYVYSNVEGEVRPSCVRITVIFYLTSKSVTVSVRRVVGTVLL